MQYIVEKGSPFSKLCPILLQNLVTKEIMTDEIKNDLLHSTEKGTLKYLEYRSNRLVEKSIRLSEPIHRLNLKTMKSLNVQPHKTTKSVIREKNINEKLLDVARDRGLSSADLLEYDAVPSSHIFDDHGLMTKPNKSQLITE